MKAPTFLTADFSGVPFTEVTVGGKQFLRGPSVILKHGVNNRGLWPLDEMRPNVLEWAGTDIVNNHPPSSGYLAWDFHPIQAHIGHLAEPEIVADGIRTAALIIDLPGLDEDHRSVIEKARKGEKIEVSVGDYSFPILKPGTVWGEASLIDLCRNEGELVPEERSQLEWSMQKYGRLIEQILRERLWRKSCWQNQFENGRRIRKRKSKLASATMPEREVLSSGSNSSACSVS